MEPHLSVHGIGRMLLCLCLLVLFGIVPAAGAESVVKGALDGRSFVVERGRMGEPPFGQDLYIFQGGRFRSVSCDRFGCEGPYTSSVNGDAVIFAADLESADHGTMHWEGMVRDDDIEVRYTVTGPPRWYERSPGPAKYWGRSVPVTSPGNAATGSMLDGKAFVIETGGVGKEADHNDIILFSDGYFVSTRCEDGGFRGKAYFATEDGDAIRFRGEVASPEKGTMIWEGSVRGDIMEGTMKWTYEKWFWTIEREYWYRGRRVE